MGIASDLAAASSDLAPQRPLHFVHMPAAQFPAALGMYMQRGDVFASVTRGERARARLPSALERAGFRTGWSTFARTRRQRHARCCCRRDVACAPHFARHALGGDEPAARPGGAPAARLQTAPPQWLGCYRDSASERDRIGDGPGTFGHTTLACAVACTGYPYFALQNGGQCFCAQQPANSSRKVSASQCGRVCALEAGKQPERLCGASWRNAVYTNPSVLSPEDIQSLGAPAPASGSAVQQPPARKGHTAYGARRRVVRTTAQAAAAAAAVAVVRITDAQVSPSSSEEQQQQQQKQQQQQRQDWEQHEIEDERRRPKEEEEEQMIILHFSSCSFIWLSWSRASSYLDPGSLLSHAPWGIF